MDQRQQTSVRGIIERLAVVTDEVFASGGKVDYEVGLALAIVDCPLEDILMANKLFGGAMFDSFTKPENSTAMENVNDLAMAGFTMVWGNPTAVPLAQYLLCDMVAFSTTDGLSEEAMAAGMGADDGLRACMGTMLLMALSRMWGVMSHEPAGELLRLTNAALRTD
jgi:hypothetical protein